MKVMTIYAHPADTITNCGGTLARHAEAGDEVVALIITHGGRIHANRYAEEWRKDNPDDAIANAGIDHIAAYKWAELQRAADIIGISRIISLDHDDRTASLQEDVIERVAEQIALERPDIIICDYPVNPVVAGNTHTVATTTVLAALGSTGTYLKNLDGQAEYHVKQVFLTSLPVFPGDALSLYGIRNDLFVDITPVVAKKIAAMDCFESQSYAGLFARKLIESNNGEFGRVAGVNFAEAYVRLHNETHTLLPLTAHALTDDPLTRHVRYSQVNLRQTHP